MSHNDIVVAFTKKRDKQIQKKNTLQHELYRSISILCYWK